MPGIHVGVVLAMLETEDHADVESGTEWARQCWAAMRPFAERATYANDLGEERSVYRKRTGRALSGCAR